MRFFCEICVCMRFTAEDVISIMSHHDTHKVKYRFFVIMAGLGGEVMYHGHIQKTL